MTKDQVDRALNLLYGFLMANQKEGTFLFTQLNMLYGLALKGIELEQLEQGKVFKK